MRILAIGDITSPAGVEHLCQKLWNFRKENKIDFCILNAENASFITGVSKELAEKLFMAGADCLSGGNHTLRNKTVYTYLDDTDAILRPLNFPESVPGHGYCILPCSGYRILVMNAMGTLYIDPVLDSPYSSIDKVLKREKGNYDFAILDFHAEATGEKVAMGYAYDGIINIVFGTHTHVQTADEQILPKGTGYITDLGMCGESEGVLGMEPSSVIKKMRTRMPERFALAKGNCIATGAIFTLDTSSNRITDVKRVKIV